MRKVIPAAEPAAPTVYLGISGVLHPSESLYELVNRRSPWDDGHTKYESIHILERALACWPEVRIVLTSTQPWAHGLKAVLSQLGPSLAGRVVSFTYDDLTSRVRYQARTRSGAVVTVSISTEDYWRMSKAKIVSTHVSWSHPEHWIAIDDEDILWPDDVRRDRLVLTCGCLGLASAAAQDRLATVLLGNFGPRNAHRGQ